LKRNFDTRLICNPTTCSIFTSVARLCGPFFKSVNGRSSRMETDINTLDNNIKGTIDFFEAGGLSEEAVRLVAMRADLGGMARFLTAGGTVAQAVQLARIGVDPWLAERFIRFGGTGEQAVDLLGFCTSPESGNRKLNAAGRLLRRGEQAEQVVEAGRLRDLWDVLDVMVSETLTLSEAVELLEREKALRVVDYV